MKEKCFFSIVLFPCILILLTSCGRSQSFERASHPPEIQPLTLYYVPGRLIDTEQSGDKEFPELFKELTGNELNVVELAGLQIPVEGDLPLEIMTNIDTLVFDSQQSYDNHPIRGGSKPDLVIEKLSSHYMQMIDAGVYKPLDDFLDMYPDLKERHSAVF
jgi:hypothetical protein